MIYEVTAYHSCAGVDVRFVVKAEDQQSAIQEFNRYCLQPEVMQDYRVVESKKRVTRSVPFR